MGDASDSGFSAKIEIKTEVPSDSSGRALDAVTDLIRPISESFGLIGDRIQLKRQETLLEIARRAKDRIELIGKPTHPIAPKFFIPLLEKASLEELTDNTLVDMWANLIATASTEKVELLGQYINILTNLVPGQVELLESMFGFDEDETYDAGHLNDNYYFLNQAGLPNSVNLYAEITDPEKFSEALLEEIDIRGVAIETINIFYEDKSRVTEGFTVTSPDGIYSDARYLDFENLVRLGLIDKIEIKGFRISGFDIDVLYYVANPVGIDLYACCNPTKLARLAVTYSAA